MMHPTTTQYLGDGVMAGFDGYHIRLWLDGETEDAPIYLDIYTADALRKYIDRIFFEDDEEA